MGLDEVGHHWMNHVVSKLKYEIMNMNNHLIMFTLNVYNHSLPGETGLPKIKGIENGQLRFYSSELLDIKNNYTGHSFIEFDMNLEYRGLVCNNGMHVRLRPFSKKRCGTHLVNTELAIFVEAQFGSTTGGYIGTDGCLYDGYPRHPTVTHALFTNEVAEIIAGYPGTEYIYGYDEDNQTLTRYV